MSGRIELKAVLRALLIVVAASGIVVACADEGPLGTASRVTPQRSADIDLGACPQLEAQGSKLAFRVYASGVQIYRWNGSAWVLAGPSAVLSADPRGESVVGTHSFGPTWESVSGSKVVGTVLQRCTPDPTAIQWLLLGVVSHEGSGVFDQVTLIQRVNTAGGLAPTSAGSFTGEEARVPYTTEYLFYRPE